MTVRELIDKLEDFVENDEWASEDSEIFVYVDNKEVKISDKIKTSEGDRYDWPNFHDNVILTLDNDEDSDEDY